MPIVSLYAAILALMFVGLSVRALRMHHHLRIAIGDAGTEMLLRAMRVHANFAEYVPLGLLLIYFVESSHAYPLFVHVLAWCLLAGRVSHAFGVSHVKENYTFRVGGMALTLTTLVAASAYLLYAYASKVSA